MKKTVFALSLIATGAVSASTYLTAVIDGDYSEWASVPVLDNDPADNPGVVDFATIKIANDDDFLYIYNSFHEDKSLGTFMAIDSDSSLTTGYNIFGLNLVGADAQWQNDFPFTSDAGAFNNGIGMSGDFFGSGAALLDAFIDSGERELAISLDIVYNDGAGPGGAGGPVFDDGDFSVLFWTDQGAGDVSAAIPYTLAVPEPSSMALLAPLAFLGCLRRRR